MEQQKCPTCQAILEEGVNRCNNCEEQTNKIVEKENKQSIKLPFNKVFLMSGSIAVIIIAIICIFVFKGSSTSEQLVYFKDGELHSLGMKNQEPIQLSNENNGDADYMSEFHILFSKDKRYVFYPDNMSDYNDSTYYWRDLTKDNSKADSSTRVDSEVHGDGFLTQDGNKFFYIKGSENRLYVYDRKSGEKSKLDDEVENFYVNEAGDYVVYRTYENEESHIYEMTVKNMKGTKTKLDVNSYIYYADMDNKSILYEKEGTMYIKEYNKEKTKIVSDSIYLPEIYNTNTFYYIKSEEVTSKLIDLVEDDLPSSDAEVTEPVYPDYPESPDYPDESDYGVQQWVDSVYGDEKNPDTGEWGYWETSVDYDAYEKAYAEYETQYEQWEEEYSKLDNEYDEAWDKYSAYLESKELREQLASEDNAITYVKYSLYFVNKGKEALVASNVSSSYEYSSSDIPFIMYKKMSDEEYNKQKLSTLIEEIGWYDVDDFIGELIDNIGYIQVPGNEVFVAYGEKEQAIDVEAVDIYNYRVDKNGNIYLLTDYDEEKEKGILMTIEVKDGVISKAKVVDEDVSLLPYEFNSRDMYYFKNYKDGSGDMYLAGKLVAEDVYVHSLYTFDDGQLLYYKDYSLNKYRGTLTLNKNGKETKISDDAAMFVPLDDHYIAFLYDYNNERNRGELMLYTGKGKPTLMDTDVSTIFGGSYY